LRRASISIPRNNAEGQGENGAGDFRRTSQIAHGSIREVEIDSSIATSPGRPSDIQEHETLSQCAEVGRLETGLSNSFRPQAV
jgi:four helix bundle protein